MTTLMEGLVLVGLFILCICALLVLIGFGLCLYDVWKYEWKFIVKEYVFRKLNNKKGM